MSPADETKDKGTEDTISWVLRVGVAASLILIAGGTIRSFLQDNRYWAGPAEVPRLIGPAGAFPQSGEWLLRGLLHFDGQAVIVAGLLLLIATPVTRVAVSLVAFARERDRAFVGITATVLFLLLLSFLLGKAG
jgi:uncharacterized membrane protein